MKIMDKDAGYAVLNSKAKGLSSSLTDYHESNLLTNLNNFLKCGDYM
ncbi:hypothetical protein ES703_41081 [subsurface metagenome]